MATGIREPTEVDDVVDESKFQDRQRQRQSLSPINRNRGSNRNVYYGDEDDAKEAVYKTINPFFLV